MESKPDTLNKDKVISLDFNHDGDTFTGEAKPIVDSWNNRICEELAIELNGVKLGTIRFTPKGWRMDANLDQPIVDAIGNIILSTYENTIER